ncbi:MAG TPA: hypothetical protein O0X39_04670 [Methanocorpusculum sp.]|nr:hypothetical protein [Methanocorpusculum sp.]
MPSKDSGVTEIVSFIIIISLIIAACLIWIMVAVPIHGENNEITHNDEVLLEMANLKYDIDTLMSSNILGVSRSCIVSFGPRGDKTQVTFLPDLSSMFSGGTIRLEAGETIRNNEGGNSGYSKLKITYQSANRYAENVWICYDGGKLYNSPASYTSGRPLMTSLHSSSTDIISAVENGYLEELGGNEFAVITFKLVNQVPFDGKMVNVFELDTGGTYNG